jgi:arylsulfatase A-like enzyme
LAGAPLPDGAAFDGEDFSAALLGKPTDRNKPLFWEYGRNNESFRYPEGKGRSPNVAIREGDWKLLLHADGTSVELYDLGADPQESANLADKKPDLARRLAEKALAWRKSLPSGSSQ